MWRMSVPNNDNHYLKYDLKMRQSPLAVFRYVQRRLLSDMEFVSNAPAQLLVE